MPNKYVDALLFVATWMEAYERNEPLDYAAEKVGMKRSSAISKASNLRLNGVLLPKLRRKNKGGSGSTKKLSVDTVNELNDYIMARLDVVDRIRMAEELGTMKDFNV